MTKSEILENLNGSFSLLEKDLNALPEELFTKCMGGKTRTVADIIFEIIEVNDHVGATIRGEVPPAWPYEGWVTAPSDFGTKEVVIAGLIASRDRFVSGVEAMSDEELNGTIQTERGESTRASRCRFVALHNWYHSGQLNFIQSLAGDDKWNW
jgi:hypothetical protein